MDFVRNFKGKISTLLFPSQSNFCSDKPGFRFKRGDYDTSGPKGNHGKDQLDRTVVEVFRKDQ